MASKTDFSDSDWKRLVQAPSIAGMYITLASPSVTDSVKESMAVASKISAAAKNSEGSGLISAVVEEFKSFANIREAQPKFESRELDKIKAEAIDSLRAAAKAANSGADASDATKYCQWVHDIATAAAEAAKEGDFLGIGGVQVNDEEKAALKDIADALGL